MPRVRRTPSRRWPHLLVVGLTGGIRSGKSTIARMFQELGATVISADQEGRAVVEPGRPALAEIVAAFGPAYLLPDGTLNRAALGDLVFSCRAALETLNRITHPRIERRLRARLAELARNPPRPPIVVLEAAILVEAGWHPLVDRTVVVATQHCTQLARLLHGSGLSRAQAEARIHAQLPLNERLRYADYRVSGEAPLSETRQQVEAIWQDLLRQVGDRNSPSAARPRKAAPSDPEGRNGGGRLRK